MVADFRRDGVRFSLVWDVLRDVVSARVADTGRQALDIVDVGGGTGGLAVPFAALGTTSPWSTRVRTRSRPRSGGPPRPERG